jgi:ketosteroid isomerase-like protein
MRPITAVLPVLLAVASAPTPAAPPPAPSPIPPLGADECAVWARELSFAQSVADHDAAAFAAHVHPDAAFGASRAAPTRGRDAITERWAGIIDGTAGGLSWYPSRVTVGPVGPARTGVARVDGPADIAWSSGPSLFEDRTPGAKARYLIGAFHSVWYRSGDGVWRVLFDDGIAPRPASAAEVEAFHAGRRSACPQG